MKPAWEVLRIDKHANTGAVMKAYRERNAEIDLKIAELEQERLDVNKACSNMRSAL